MGQARADQIVVTGMGGICHLGDELDAICGVLRSGKTKPFSRWQPAVDHGAKCQILGAYEGDLSDAALGIGKKESRFMGRQTRLALKASRIALAQSGIDPRPLAVVVGSGTGDTPTNIEIQDKIHQTGDIKRVSPTVIPKLMASSVSANLVNVLRTVGPSFSATAACAGGNYNLLLAAQLISSGHVSAALAGGVEAIDLHFFAGFDAMGAYNRQDNEHPERASRPYAKDRAGFIFGEGAGLVVLEKRADAEKRGAKILGALEGYGMSSDGEGQMVAPSSDGAYRAMRGALKHAGLTPADIDYVNTHGTSTPVGDISEVKAMRKLFEKRVAYSSTKGYTGHTISAAGALEAIFTWKMLSEGWIASSVNASPVDPEIEDYAPVLEPTDRAIKYALSSSFGFGGTNAAVVLSAG